MLGQLPDPSLLSQIPLLSSTPVVSTVTTPILSAPALESAKESQGTAAPMVISSALPPILGKLVSKILSGAFVEMRELLSDNLRLRRQLEIQDEFSATAPHEVRPPLREVQIISSWVYCMASYLKVLALAGKMRPEHLAYLRIVVAEAAKYKNDGWRLRRDIPSEHGSRCPGKFLVAGGRRTPCYNLSSHEQFGLCLHDLF